MSFTLLQSAYRLKIEAQLVWGVIKITIKTFAGWKKFKKEHELSAVNLQPSTDRK